MNPVSDIYDSLFLYETKKKGVSYPIHKRLTKGGKADGLLHWLLENINFVPGEKVLDGGCGNGHTLFQLSAQKRIHGKGISISKKEISAANQHLQKLGYNLVFDIHDFHQPLTEPFHKVLALESLKHAQDLEQVVVNFASILKNNGQMIIADDFVVKRTSLSEKQKKLWNSPSMVSIAELENILCRLGFRTNVYDLTKQVPARSTFFLTSLQYCIALIRPFLWNRSRINMDTYMGALLLEKLYRKKHVRYCVVVANKTQLKNAAFRSQG